ncbi:MULTISPECIES: hypothetical protein [unclassified Mesorhizobium]|uniref:hypothetical protein n=1 Tax=unclassified Mesorhizobium TaxID=325217 RepID=UPI000FDA619A|nr:MULTISPECIES: hypothetical protein [unclassified Mesorhizobium]TGT76712.1 hypothetical protein EN809_003655 [Mesorhizobium sp. M2E.F.Ca.ET.166.01.1.1]TGW02824.1 hypothetical protein EN797_003655 [Mesorhizobium sp. M2E.F.Ca.ET.154.01.1.1]
MSTTFLPTKDFTGFPDGNHRNPVQFAVGVESPPVPEAFAQAMFDNGLGKPTTIDPLTAATSKKIATAIKIRRTGKSSRQSSSQD